MFILSMNNQNDIFALHLSNFFVAVWRVLSTRCARETLSFLPQARLYVFNIFFDLLFDARSSYDRNDTDLINVFLKLATYVL